MSFFRLLVFAAGALVWAQKPITVETLQIDQPMAMEAAGAVWSPEGGRFVYRKNGALVVYDAAKQSSVAVVSSLKDVAGKAMKLKPMDPAFDWENRRVSESTLQWFPAGDALLLKEGGDLFRVALPGGEVTNLTNSADTERDAKLSPDGRWLSYRLGADLYAREVTSGREKRLTKDGSATMRNAQLDWVYPEELDLSTAHWWSPDGQRIAFLQFDVSPIGFYPHADLSKLPALAEPQRYPHAGTPNSRVKLFIVEVKNGKLREAQLGDLTQHLLARVHWLDAKRVAVHKFTRIQDQLSLMAVDAMNGKAEEILAEKAAAWINVNDVFSVEEGGKRMLRGSEKSGYLHLYLYDLSTKQETALTSGSFPVNELLAVDWKRGMVWISSAEQEALGRHIYRVNMATQKRELLTPAAGTWTASMPDNGAFALLTHSSGKEAPQRVLASGDGKVLKVLTERNRSLQAEYQLLAPEFLSVKAGDGETLYARLTKPAGFDAKKRYPAVVLVYGGPGPQTVRNVWAGISMEQVLAHRGFVVWQLDNRGSGNRGHLWEARLHRRFGRAELEDQKRGIAYLVDLGFVDRERIGMSGWSYGGYMTLYTLLNEPELIKAGISGAPVTNWRLYDTIYTERYLGLPKDNEQGYADSSVVNKAANLKGRLLLVHNLGDDNVLFQNMLQMTEALQRANKPFELQVYPLKSHGVSGALRPHLDATMVDFFERHLKN
jgi:dipeptidyl-peptidase 4